MRQVLIILIALISLNVFSQSERKYIRKGNKEYTSENYNEAEVQYRKALEKAPDSKKADYNLANTLYKKEEYESAGTKYLDITVNEKNKYELAKYYYNLGNSMFKKNDFQKSIEAYKNSLRNNPGDMDAKHNLQLAQSMMQMQQQQQQQQQNQQHKEQDNQQQQQQQQQKQKQQQGQEQQAQQQPYKKDEISKEDAERLLDALEREEEDVMKKLQKQVAKIPVEKNW
jgi:Ca-activated chloride channel family protein